MKKLKLLSAIFTLIVGLAIVSTAQTTLQSVDGSGVSIEAQRGKVVVLAIGASWLPLSKQQTTIASALQKKYAGRDVVIYFVSTDSTNAKSKNFASDEQLKAFAARNKVTMPILRDSDGATTLRKYKIDQIPSFVVLDKDGNPTGEAFGGLDTDAAAMDNLTKQIAAAIDKIL